MLCKGMTGRQGMHTELWWQNLLQNSYLEDPNRRWENNINIWFWGWKVDGNCLRNAYNGRIQYLQCLTVKWKDLHGSSIPLPTFNLSIQTKFYNVVDTTLHEW